MENIGDTFTRLYLHLVFAVGNKTGLIQPSWEEELNKYMTGAIQNKNQTVLAIKSHRDHIHILIKFLPTCVISDLVREVKKSSTNFINEKGFVRNGRFSWQEGYGAFSCTHWNVQHDVDYVMNQKEYHRKKSFKEEYIQLLEDAGIDYKEEYLFEWIEN